MSTITTRKWDRGVLVEEKTEQVDWELSAADLDLVSVECECGNSFKLPYDCMGFMDGLNCGQCGEAGKITASDRTASST